MQAVRRSQDRGYFENNWLKSFHSFSFSDYYDPKHMNFRNLRVINHDFIAVQSGFPTHPHRDMEIITYVLKGAVAHKDSMGNQTQILAGEVQVMSAGSGITHSEYNPDPKQQLELLQIWLTPNRGGIKPNYGQRQYSQQDKLNQFKLIASIDQAEDSLKINQDVRLMGTYLEAGKSLTYEVPGNRYAWLQVAEGEIEVNGETLKKGDAIAVDSNEKSLKIKALQSSDFVLFDLN